MEQIRVRLNTRPKAYDVKISGGLLSDLGVEARACLRPEARRVAVISNSRVFGLYGKRAVQSLRHAKFTVVSWLMGDGERHKTWRTLDQALTVLSDAGLDRGDAVIALGGGVVTDLAGFAAATYLRGVDLIQVPTTLLAQIDASIGGKTGVNTPAGKNLVGAFYQPRLVLIDTDTLETLPERELTAGWCEALKQGAVGNRKLFNQTCDFLRTSSKSRTAEVIAAHCAFKASIVSRDEREDLARNDKKSRRILNFGHTIAHALETVTRYRRFRHGEAVGLGMLVAGEISKGLGMLPASELESLREAVRLCGRLPRADDLSVEDIARAIARDKKVAGGEIKWVLIERIGSARLVGGSEIPTALLCSSIRVGLKTSSDTRINDEPAYFSST